MAKVNVRQRNGTWYVDFAYRDQSGVRRRFKKSTGPNTTQKEALALARLWKKQADAQGQVPGAADADNKLFDKQEKPRYPFSGFAKHFLDTYVKAYNKPSEYRGKESVIRVHLVPFFGDRDISEINGSVPGLVKT